MRTNPIARAPDLRTYEGAPAFVHLTVEQQLRRSVLSNLLWEHEFYEAGVAIAERVRALVEHAGSRVVADLAIEARNLHNLRHMPLYLVALLVDKCRGTSLVSETLPLVIQRADELTEFMAIYCKINGIAPAATPSQLKPHLAHQVRKGLAAALYRFNEYNLAKYDRDTAIKLRDVIFLCHPKPKNDPQQLLWERVISRTLETPDTWEVALSTGADKAATFVRLIAEDKLGYLALLRNLRNMVQAGVDDRVINDAIRSRFGARRVLPFRYVAAARAAPQFEPAIDEALVTVIRESPTLLGRTVVLVDVSGSMDTPLSAKSGLTRMDAAACLASMINAESLRIFSFSQRAVEVPPRRGMAGVDAIQDSQPHTGTDLIGAVGHIHRFVPHDRLIVISDEQAGFVQ